MFCLVYTWRQFLIIQGVEIYELCGLLRGASNYRIDPTLLLMAPPRYRVTLWPKNEQNATVLCYTSLTDDDDNEQTVEIICCETFVTDLTIGYIWILHVHQHFSNFFFPFFWNERNPFSVLFFLYFFFLLATTLSYGNWIIFFKFSIFHFSPFNFKLFELLTLTGTLVRSEKERKGNFH